eukprot:4140167-Karenia_brevis.AAC.1
MFWQRPPPHESRLSWGGRLSHKSRPHGMFPASKHMMMLRDDVDEDSADGEGDDDMRMGHSLSL